MGGIGSGGHNKIGDDEKRRRGTFRADRSEEARAQAAAAKVVTGPWLTSIPEPELPLNEVGRKKYDELTKVLFDANKLTAVTRMAAEQVAVLFQEQHARLSAGKSVPASLSDKLQRALSTLKIAEDAKPIENPEGKKNKFARCGFSSRLPAAR
jgi:hypothetical protein